MKRQTAIGIEKDVPISVAREGRRRAKGTTLRVAEYPQGLFVHYRDGFTGCERLAPINAVRIIRSAERRRKSARQRLLTAEDVAD